ncbi:hypothetical protein BA20089_00030 [Bifidobacterium asteroides DSM 20089]|uniref:Uncharacterized protein n=1 Tax=Bifidobacterium asteroides DSM 20089 TaxID=1437594 RepID=A0AAD0A8L4_9BIFI|nr:hypothetical protein BA20089_00030 [Bifidobacterium asteroides DSM 20089]
MLTCAQAVVAFANAVALIVFGVMLLRDMRRHAARWAYMMMAVTFVQGMLALALQGLGLGVGLSMIQIAILVALAIALDPALIGERAVRRRLKRMDEHDEYIEAKGAGMLGPRPERQRLRRAQCFQCVLAFCGGLRRWGSSSRRSITSSFTTFGRTVQGLSGDRSRRFTGSGSWC